jgi:hypothetical protein
LDACHILVVAGLPELGEPMEARKLLDAAPFSFETIDTLKQALEDAWSSIAAAIPPESADIIRMSLAHAIVARAAGGEIDCAALKAAAVKAVLIHPPRVTAEHEEPLS